MGWSREIGNFELFLFHWHFFYFTLLTKYWNFTEKTFGNVAGSLHPWKGFSSGGMCWIFGTIFEDFFSKVCFVSKKRIFSLLKIMLLSSSLKKDVILRNFICMCWLRRRDNILHIERNNTNETCICNVRLVFLFWFQSHDRNTFGGNFQDHFLSAIKKIINFHLRNFPALIIEKDIWIFPRFSNSVFDYLPGHIHGLEFPKTPAECPFRNTTVTLSKRPNLCQCEAWISETWAPTYDDLAFYVVVLLGLHRIFSSRFLQSAKIRIEWVKLSTLLL